MKRLYWGILIGFFILFSFSPTVYELSQKEKLNGRTFELVHNYITDYNFYLSRIREGMEGRWTVIEQYTSESHGGSLVQIFYLLLGKTDNHAPTMLLGVTGAYHSARIVFGATVLILIALWVRFLFPTLLWQTIAFLVVVTASVWPHVVPVGDSLRFGGPMSWWTLMDNLQRLTFLPHLLIGQALLVFLLFAGGNEETLKKSGNWVFLGILAFVLGMIFPPGLVFVGVTYGVMILLSFFTHLKLLSKKSDRETWISTQVLSRVLIGLLSFPSFVYFSLMLTMYPWKRLMELDVIHPLPFQFPEYILALGPTLPLGILGLLLVFIKKDRKFMSAVAWVIAWMLCLFVFQYIPQQSPLRFSEMLPQVPLGILTTYLFYQIFFSTQLFFRSPKENDEGGIRNNGRFQKSIVFIILYSLFIIPIALGFGVMTSSFLWQKDFIDQKIAAGWPGITMNNIIVYPITGFVDGLMYLEKNIPKDAVVLSDMTAGNYIPPYTGRRVFVGHDNTVNLESKREEARMFFRGETNDAYEWLTGNGIGSVFFGPQEKELGKLQDLITAYPFLQEVYKNVDVTIYVVP